MLQALLSIQAGIFPNLRKRLETLCFLLGEFMDFLPLGDFVAYIWRHIWYVSDISLESN
jgi:hypothetical protein